MDAQLLLADQRIVPVVVIDDPKTAVPLATTFVEAGLGAIEVTLRTPAAMKAIELIAKSVPECLLGAGSVITAAQLNEAAQVGARFAVSPGSSEELLAAAQKSKLPLVPGAASASEIMNLQSAGYTLQKLFPAELNGGTAWLKAISGPLPDARFFPTGGVKPENAPAYLALDNVRCVGGTWIASRDAISNGDFKSIKAKSLAALDLLAAS